MFYDKIPINIRNIAVCQHTAHHIAKVLNFYFSLTGYFYFRRVVRNDSLVRRLRRQRSKPCAVGRWERLSVGVGSRF